MTFAYNLELIFLSRYAPVILNGVKELLYLNGVKELLYLNGVKELPFLSRYALSS